VTLTLTARRAVGESTVSASTTVPLRIVAPAPTALIGTNEFEVPVGEPFSVVLRSDAGSFASVSLNDRLLPPGIEDRGLGTITGTNVSTSAPFEFILPVTFNSGFEYEGGGILVTNVVFRLRNSNPPLFMPLTNKVLAAVGVPLDTDLNLTWSNHPFIITATGLPPGLRLEPGGNVIRGTPTTPGIFSVTLTATNRPSVAGSTSPAHWLSGVGEIVVYVANERPKNVVPSSPGILPSNTDITGLNFYLVPGGSASLPVRTAAFGLPPGLTVDPETSLLKGSTGAPGQYQVMVFLVNGRGWIKKTVTLTIQ